MSSFQYDDSQLMSGLIRFEQRVKNALRDVARYWAGVFENYAKENARWKDQTGNARQALHTFVEEVGDDFVILYLAHGVEYGIHLETKYAGRYAIIWDTIEAHIVQIRQMLQRIFG